MPQQVSIWANELSPGYSDHVGMSLSLPKGAWVFLVDSITSLSCVHQVWRWWSHFAVSFLLEVGLIFKVGIIPVTVS